MRAHIEIAHVGDIVLVVRGIELALFLQLSALLPERAALAQQHAAAASALASRSRARRLLRMDGGTLG